MTAEQARFEPAVGYIESPTITIAEPGTAANATAVVTSEDSKFGGNAILDT